MTLPDPTTAQFRSEAACLDAYRAYLARTYRAHFGVHDAAQANLVAEDWFHCDARHDFRFEEMEARLPRTTLPHRFLDLASGMGTALLRGLHRGLDGYGIEPDPEKLGLMRQRMAAGNFPEAWSARFARAVGEHLPYPDDAFDCVLSYQTLEHVQNIDAVIAEMLRVTRPGGALHLRCPDYRGTFEGHYLLPWLPLMPRPVARFWLRLRGRPTTGFEGVVYTTQRGLIRSLTRAAQCAGIAIEILDLETERLRGRLREKKLPRGSGAMVFWKAAIYARKLFREETQINLWVTVGPKRNSRPVSAPR
jgi:SAM-dependent methyltransferase